jgi:hypothetical protein
MVTGYIQEEMQPASEVWRWVRYGYERMCHIGIWDNMMRKKANRREATGDLDIMMCMVFPHLFTLRGTEWFSVHPFAGEVNRWTTRLVAGENRRTMDHGESECGATGREPGSFFKPIEIHFLQVLCF